MTGDRAIVRLRRTIFAPPDRVYRALLDADMLRRWLVPRGFGVARAEIDERAGGTTASGCGVGSTRSTRRPR